MQGGTLVNREHFIKQNILTTSIFINAAGFLRIVQDEDYKEPKSRSGQASDFSDDPDPLDNTRVHPEDYDLARKMALDALELDKEDVEMLKPFGSCAILSLHTTIVMYSGCSEI